MALGFVCPFDQESLLVVWAAELMLLGDSSEWVTTQRSLVPPRLF